MNPLEKQRLTVSVAPEEDPAFGSVAPKVGKPLRVRPEPAFALEPKPKTAVFVRVGIGPAELRMVNPTARMRAEGS